MYFIICGIAMNWSTKERLQKSKHPERAKSIGSPGQTPPHRPCPWCHTQTELCPVCSLCMCCPLPPRVPVASWSLASHDCLPSLHTLQGPYCGPWGPRTPMPAREEQSLPCTVPRAPRQLINKPQKHFSSHNTSGIRADRKEELFDLITWLCPTEPFTC